MIPLSSPIFDPFYSFFRRWLTPLGGALLCLSPIAARGQSVSFVGAEVTLPMSDVASRGAFAVDRLGNVYITDTNNSDLVELPLTAKGYGPQTILPATLNTAIGIAADNSGNLFIADDGHNRLVELPWTPTGFGPQTTLPTTGLLGTVGVATDNFGDVFVTGLDLEGDAGLVLELPRTPTGYGPPTPLPFIGLVQPWDVKVDSTGDVFVADPGNNDVVELPWTPMGFGPQITLPTVGLNQPTGVAVDSTGEVFVTNDVAGVVVELPKTATGYGPQTNLPLGSEILPLDLALDSLENLFILSDQKLVQDQRHAAAFSGANVCAPGATTPAPCSQTLTLNYKTHGNVTFGTPEVLTGGLTHLDFTLASGSTCIGEVPGGKTCTVKLSFAPMAAGFRSGSVEITDGGGTVIATTPLSGFGIAATSGPPVAQVSTTYLQLGTIAFGTSETMSLIVANIGGGTLTVAPSISTYSGGASSSYSIGESTCGAGVTSGNSCTLVVEFSPNSIATHDDLLSLHTNGSISPTVKLHGAVSGLSVFGGGDGNSFKFGSVSSGSSEILPLTVTNVGLPGTVTIGAWIMAGSKHSPYTILTTAQNTCLAGIEAGQSCTLPVEFAPVSSGIHDDLLTLTPSAGGGDTTLWLTGSTP